MFSIRGGFDQHSVADRRSTDCARRVFLDLSPGRHSDAGQNTRTPGTAIGINGTAGNLGIALAAVSTGLLVKYFGWRTAFMVPGALALLTGAVFARYAPREQDAPARRAQTHVHLPRHLAVRTFAVMVASATTGSLIFNFTTNGNAQLMAERFDGLISDPAILGALLAGIYTLAAFAQVVVGRLIDRVPVKPLFLAIVASQVVVFALRLRQQRMALVRRDHRLHDHRIRFHSVQRRDGGALHR